VRRRPNKDGHYRGREDDAPTGVGEDRLSEPAVEYIAVNGEECRVWRMGDGPRIGFLAGHGGLPKWIPFLDALADSFEVVVPSLPGYPGANGHQKLDSHIDWVLAVGDLLHGTGLDQAAALVGSGPGGSFAAEAAAFWPQAVPKLALISPWGLFDEADPMTDPWGQRKPDMAALVCHDPDRWNELKAAPEGANSVEWPIEQTRAMEASARAFWPLGNSGLERRLGHIGCPTLLVWGDSDKVVPRSYAEKFKTGIRGESKIEIIPNAGHLAELDRPAEVAAAIQGFVA
jgi:pimeloyl-ACP methyl ester carboxylesterase